MAGKRWNGGAWVDIATGKRWNGGAWVDIATGKRWNGSTWVDVYPNIVNVDVYATSTTLRAAPYVINNNLDIGYNGNIKDSINVWTLRIYATDNKCISSVAVKKNMVNLYNVDTGTSTNPSVTTFVDFHYTDGTKNSYTVWASLTGNPSPNTQKSLSYVEITSDIGSVDPDITTVDYWTVDVQIVTSTGYVIKNVYLNK